MKRTLVVTGTAEAELTILAEYIARSSIRTAIRFYEAAQDSFQRIVRSPDLGVTLEFDAPAANGVRAWAIRGFPNHLIYYRHIDSGIEVLRVLHGARDTQDAFP
jgi:toxin ParE1/3/4